MDPDSKRISTGGSTDRLSNLPCNIISHILALLPLKETVRTSVLSKKWNNRWLTIPHLVFEEDTSESVIHHVLQLHKDPIVKFVMKYRIEEPLERETALYHWFDFLSKHKIEQLTILLYSYMYQPRHVIPNHLFSFYNLKHLSLREVEVRVPLSTYNGFSHLISIEFEHVDIEVEEFQRLIGKCPKLESLRLSNCFKITNTTLHIITPHNLRSFHFAGSVDFIYIYSNPQLEDVSIYYGKHKVNTEILDYAIKFFSQLSLVKKLEVNSRFLQVLARSVPLKLPTSLSQLKHIHLHYPDLDSVNDLKTVLFLIRISPNLQSIVINLFESAPLTWYYKHSLNDVYRDYKDAAIEYLKEEQKSAVPLSSSLKEVKIYNFIGWEPEMEFVKLLFLGAVELRKVEITGICKEQQFSIRETLESFRRSSSQEIILKD